MVIHDMRNPVISIKEGLQLTLKMLKDSKNVLQGKNKF
jgi:hypothetical protein